MIDLFQILSQPAMAGVIADFLPQGRAWDKKSHPESNIYKTLRALAVVYIQNQGAIRWLSEEGNIYTSSDLLGDWEKSVGLPDECLSDLDSLNTRRGAVVSRIRKVPYVDLRQIEDLLQFFFPLFAVRIQAGADAVPVPTKEDRFTLIVNLALIKGDQFEYEHEYEFVAGTSTDNIICFLRKIVPANVYIAINFEV
jgi:uncharacterized protein YmfQ (DUF2313 family)